MGPFRLEAAILDGFLKCSYFFSNFFILSLRHSNQFVIGLLSPPFIPLFYLCFCYFILFPFPGSFLNFILSLLLNFLCCHIFYLQEVFFVISLSFSKHTVPFCFMDIFSSLTSSRVILKFLYSSHLCFVQILYCYLFCPSLIFIVFFKKQGYHI